MRRLASGLLLLACVVACDTSISQPSSIDVSIVANRTTVALGETVTFQVNGRGAQLLGFEIAYGDGASDQLAAGGAQTASTMFQHAYSAVGTFTVAVVMTDAALGQKEASVEIRVN
jgi:hypothetical protein